MVEMAGAKVPRQKGTVVSSGICKKASEQMCTEEQGMRQVSSEMGQARADQDSEVRDSGL